MWDLIDDFVELNIEFEYKNRREERDRLYFLSSIA